MIALLQRTLLLSLVTALIACAGPKPLKFVDDPTGVGTRHKIFVATSRERVEAEQAFGSERAHRVSYRNFTVSVPPRHRAGKIEWPRGKPDPKSDFVTVDSREYSGAAEFRSAIDAAASRRPVNRREAVVFVHGFNNDFAQGVYRLAQIYHDIEPPGIAVQYSWPSRGRTTAYLYDRESTFFARDGLEELLVSLSQTSVSRILLVGHSVGAFLAVETLRQMSIRGDRDVRRKLSGVVLVSPDIDIEVFRSQISRIDPLPDPFIVFVSNRDQALGILTRLIGQTERLGSLSDIADLKEIDITVINTSEFRDGDVNKHFTPATSPSVIAVLKALPRTEIAESLVALQNTEGPFVGTVRTQDNVTEIVLVPESR